jgi:hypothetical protein
VKKRCLCLLLIVIVTSVLAGCDNGSPLPPTIVSTIIASTATGVLPTPAPFVPTAPVHPTPTAIRSVVIALTPGALRDDPFGSAPQGASPNCGPEERYKVATIIDSKQRFVAFIRDNPINPWVQLDNFRNEQGLIDWQHVVDAVTTTVVSGRTIYSLRYNPQTCSGFVLKMTNDGYISVYGCCGV